ncbi:hypothetical protein ACNAN0_04485 [Agrilactobacillus fermenti]|uniref:hypothetical protein n=1 Tax=Agrilactobacillus fermenti TaxID=2586909 RepID=UPI001E456AEF|nr:hypothetical protein [Agrilactobacillus fermenti]MCD2256744.1 hypothetical protein [Agrilactobacillus fermenti]
MLNDHQLSSNDHLLYLGEDNEISVSVVFYDLTTVEFERQIKRLFQAYQRLLPADATSGQEQTTLAQVLGHLNLRLEPKIRGISTANDIHLPILKKHLMALSIDHLHRELARVGVAINKFAFYNQTMAYYFDFGKNKLLPFHTKSLTLSA